MQDRIKFKETLDAILEISKSKNNTLTMDEIKEYFQDSELSNEQYGLIFDYLTANHIVIENYSSKDDSIFLQSPKEEDASVDLNGTVSDNESDRTVKEDAVKTIAQISKKDREYLEHYKHELSLLYSDTVMSIEDIFLQSDMDSETFKKVLLDKYLLNVVDYAYEFAGRGVSAADLIGEGNIGLMLAVEEVSGNHELSSAHGAERYIITRIKNAMSDHLDLDNHSKTAEEQMLLKVTSINDAAKVLAEENMRLPTVSEIAEYTRVAEDEIQSIMKLSKEDLGVKLDPKE